MQCKFRNIYARFTNISLPLSELSTINIDNIKQRKSLVSGYLINLKNIDDCENKLEEDSKKLIVENKRSDANKKLYERLEENLKLSFLRAEGRINDNLDYTSVLKEYEENGFDIKKLLSDSEMLDSVYKQVEKLRKEKDELLQTGNICYENDPNRENRNVLADLTNEAYKARYKLILIKIAMIISNNVNDYDELLSKRRTLLELIDSRKQCLFKLKRIIMIDPFDRIKVKEQMKYIYQLSDNSKGLTSLIKEITELTSKLEELKNKNKEFLKEINIYHEFYNDIINNDKKTDIDDETNFMAFSIKKNKSKSNQVVALKDGLSKSTKRIADEKAKRTASKVLEIYNDGSLSTNNNEYPQLVIEKQDMEQEKYDEIFPETNYFEMSSIDESVPKENLKEEDNQIFPETDYFEMSSIDESISKENAKEEDNQSKDDQIFQDNADKPFEDPFLYSDMIGETEENNQLRESNKDGTMELPVAFWGTQEKTSPKVEEKESLSIDEQIKQLKLVA